MSIKRKVALISAGVIICLAAAIGWWYVSDTYVEFQPLVPNDKNELVEVEGYADFYKNLEILMKEEGIDYRINILDHPEVPLKIALNKNRVASLTKKACDIVWVYQHRERDYPSFPCAGEGYEGVVFYKDSLRNRNDSAIDLTCNDIKATEQIFQSAVKKAGGPAHWNIKLPLAVYYRQYYGYVNKAGEKIVEIEMPLMGDISSLWYQFDPPSDGGDIFLHAVINLTRKEIVSFYNNGNA